MLDLKDDPEAIHWMSTSYKTIVPSAMTGGAMSVVDSVTAPGEGPPRHVHAAEDETFIVLSGRLRFWLSGEEFERGPGETAFVPRGAEHTFQAVGKRDNRHLTIITPGGFEGFFAEMAAHRYAIPADMKAIEAAAGRYHCTFTGPPLRSGR